MNEMAMTVAVCGEYYVSIWLHTTADPSTQLWNEGVERVAEVKRKLNGDVSKIRTLAFSDGGAPNSMQRGLLFANLLEGKAKVAGVSSQLSNRLVRGITTAIFWLNPSFRAYPPEHFGQALAHLDLADHHAKVIATVRELQKSISPLQTVTQAFATFKP